MPTEHIARPGVRAPRIVFEHVRNTPGADNYIKAVVFHREPGGEYRQHLFFEGFSTRGTGAARLAQRRLRDVVFPWISRHERTDRTQAGDKSYRPEILMSVLHPVPDFEMHVIGDL